MSRDVQVAASLVNSTYCHFNAFVIIFLEGER